MQLREVCDRGQRILLVGIDAEEPHAPPAVFFGQLGQAGRVALSQRALGPQKDHDVGPALLPAGDRVGTQTIGERRRLDVLAHWARRRIRAGSQQQAD